MCFHCLLFVEGCGGIWALGWKSSAQRTVSCSVGAWDHNAGRAVQNTEAWRVEFLREAKTPPGLLPENLVSGQLQLKNQL